MTNKEKAIGYMKDLGIFDDAIKAFETDDIVFFSINGFIYSLTPQMRQTISEIKINCIAMRLFGTSYTANTKCVMAAS